MFFFQPTCCNKGEVWNKAYHISFLQMCVSYIFTKIYMYIHTHLFLQLVEWWLGIVAPIWDDIEKLLAGSIGCSPLADVSLCVYLCVFTDTVWPWVFENLQQLHILDLSIEWFLTSFFGPPHWANLVVKTSGNFIGLDIFPRTFGQDLLQSWS